GSADELYERPASEFVANFLGSSNLIDQDGARVMIRPERIHMLAAGEQPNANEWRVQPAVVQERAFLGPFMRYLLRLDDGTEVLVFEQNAAGFAASQHNARGTAVHSAWRHDSVYHIPEGE